MKIISLPGHPDIVMYASNDVCRQCETLISEDGLGGSTVEQVNSSMYEQMFEERIDPKFLQFVESHGNKRGKKGMRVLHAHGGIFRDQWVYYDDGKPLHVQTWIDLHENDCAAIVLLVCNRGRFTTRSESAPVFISDSIVGSGFALTDEHGEFHFTLRLPDGEEIDGNTIDWHIDNLFNG